MEVFVKDNIGLWQDRVVVEVWILASFLQLWVALEVELLELFKSSLKRVAEFDGNFLLFLENKFVILHVLFGVGFKVASQLMKIQAVFVGTLLAVQEELAKLARSERCTNQTFVVHVLVHR